MHPARLILSHAHVELIASRQICPFATYISDRLKELGVNYVQSNGSRITPATSRLTFKATGCAYLAKLPGSLLMRTRWFSYPAFCMSHHSLSVSLCPRTYNCPLSAVLLYSVIAQDSPEPKLTPARSIVSDQRSAPLCVLRCLCMVQSQRCYTASHRPHWDAEPRL